MDDSSVEDLNMNDSFVEDWNMNDNFVEDDVLDDSSFVSSGRTAYTPDLSHQHYSESISDERPKTETTAVALSFSSLNSLSQDEVADIFFNAKDLYKDQISRAPPVQPKEGEIFLFDLGPDKSVWESYKRKFR